MDKYSHYFYDYFEKAGSSKDWATLLNMLALLSILFLAIYLIDKIIGSLLISISKKVAKTSKSSFDDFLIEHKSPNLIAHIIPLIISLQFLDIVFVDFEKTKTFVETLLDIYTVFLCVFIIRSFARAFSSYIKSKPKYKGKPIDSFIQVVMILIWLIAAALCFVLLTNSSVAKFFTSLGVASSVILLIFKNSILGFVASLQISANDSVRIGDWVSMPKYNADGDVIGINLTNIQIQNFDKTISNIPTYVLMTDAFTNWRGMQESGGRRIKRSVIIKTNSVHFLKQDEIEELKKIHLLEDYLGNRQTDVNAFNNSKAIDKSILINGRNLTNLGIFRKYIQLFVESHSAINKDMTIMTRQLAPTSEGIPIEIYAFSKDQRWQNYEYIMSDIFDHVLASVTYFNLEVFELISSTENLPKQ